MKLLLSRSILAVCCVMFVIQFAAGQSLESGNEIFVDEEWLRYKVKWGLIRLGSVEVTQQRIDTPQSPKYVVQIKAESRSLPFINLYFVNRSILDASKPVNEHFNLFLGRDHQSITTYSFDRANHKIYMVRTDNGNVVRHDTLSNIYIAYDAGGIFMMMRILSAYDTSAHLPTLSEFQLKGTDIVFSNKSKMLKVDAADAPISARYFEGTAHWVGSSWGGVSGPFNGWVSADEAAIPLKINMKIFLGSVTLELEKFRRPNRTILPIKENENLIANKSGNGGTIQ